MIKLEKQILDVLRYNREYPNDLVAFRGIRKHFRDYIRSCPIDEEDKAILIEGLLDEDTIDV